MIGEPASGSTTPSSSRPGGARIRWGSQRNWPVTAGRRAAYRPRHAGGADRPAGPGRAVEPGDRRPAVPVPRTVQYHLGHVLRRSGRPPSRG